MLKIKLINLCNFDVRIYPDPEDLIKCNAEHSYFIVKSNFYIALDYSNMSKLEPLRTKPLAKKVIIKDEKRKIIEFTKLLTRRKNYILEEPKGLLFFNKGIEIKNITLLDFLKKATIENDFDSTKFLIAPSVSQYISKYYQEYSKYFYSPNTSRNLLCNGENLEWLGTAFVSRARESKMIDQIKIESKLNKIHN